MLGFDLETYPIGPKRAPEVVVGAFNISKVEALKFQVFEWSTQIKDLGDRVVCFFWPDRLGEFLQLCESVEGPIVAHNAAYDWSCISAYDASFIKRIFSLFKARKLQCTYLRTLIHLNSTGDLKTKSSTKIQLAHGSFGYTTLVGAVRVYTGKDLSDVKDHEVQISYYKMEAPEYRDFMKWPSNYRDYLVQDVEFLPDLFYGQELLKYVPLSELGNRPVDIFLESPRRAAFHYALTLASAWGVRVDKAAVASLRNSAEAEVQAVANRMVEAGFAEHLEGRALAVAKESGKLTIKLDNKKIQTAVAQQYFPAEPPKTASGSVSTTRDVLKDLDRFPLLQEWASVGDKKTIWSTFVPALEKSFENGGVLNTSFFPYSDTGRISARDPNLLNPPRGGGIRDCIVARPGCTFIFCDYEANEMRVLSQVLLDMFGSSVLAKNYQDNTHFDPHSYMASRWMNISYEEGMSKKENKDKEFKKVRQLMKSCNFGFPGGMAPTTFVDFAKGYGVSISEQEALDLKKFFFGQFPEIAAYLDKVGTRVRHHKGQGYLPRAQRLSGDRRFCQLANFYFQGLAAEGGLTAFTLISEACYTKPESPLYGCRPVLFVHDEIIVEAPLSKAHFAALEVKRIMETSMQIFTPDVPSLAEPTLATKWWKDAFQKYDENGHLVPSDI